MTYKQAKERKIIDGNRLDYLKLFKDIFDDQEKKENIYEHIIEQLWDIIDDIDSYGDMAKSDNKLFRGLTEKRQKDRWKLPITTDGNKLDLSNIDTIKA